MTRFRLLMMSAALIPCTAAIAQDYNDQAPPPGYDDQGPPQGYDDQGPPPNYDDQAPPPGYDDRGPPPGYEDQGPPPGYQDQGPPSRYDDEPAPPQGYNGSQLPPAPPGYQPEGDINAQMAEDRRYGSWAEEWARDNCVKAHGDVGAGAVIGGVVGAIIGSGLAGRHDRGAGIVAGGALGAAGGAAIAAHSDSGATSPGCPPGYVVRNGAPPFSYGGGGGAAFLYAAPDWYQPWYFSGGHWLYRPYPYHIWYYRHYRWGDRWRGRGWRGGGHYRRWDRH